MPEKKMTKERCTFCPVYARYFIGWNRKDGTKGWGWVCKRHDGEIGVATAKKQTLEDIGLKESVKGS